MKIKKNVNRRQPLFSLIFLKRNDDFYLFIIFYINLSVDV